ncbi:DUF6503 family protein [Polaribacter sp.]|uniref:DUF6503 family protein n=1 Tax=Polaribacter sp. TaxID=1920175 RepID=UPI003F699ACB
MKKLILLLFILCSLTNFSQEITGEQLLNRAIKFHDPNNNWSTFKGTLFVTMKTPNRPKRESEITIDLPKEYFSVKAQTSGNTTTYNVINKNANIKFNGNIPTEEEKKKYNLNIERANLYKNYYTYLYGLPMKLKDEGTIVHKKIERKKFKGKEYLVLKVTYPKQIGKDTWYFYFDPTTYAMEVYQFFKDTKESGEYILLSGLEIINGIKMPKNRAWYYNKDDGYLGTDFLSTKK